MPCLTSTIGNRVAVAGTRRHLAGGLASVKSGPAGGRAEQDLPRQASRRAADSTAWLGRCRRLSNDYEFLRVNSGADAHYRRQREYGDWHAAAQSNLFNRMIGKLYYCLQHRKLFDEHTAFPTELAAAA